MVLKVSPDKSVAVPAEDEGERHHLNTTAAQGAYALAALSEALLKLKNHKHRKNIHKVVRLGFRQELSQVGPPSAWKRRKGKMDLEQEEEQAMRETAKAKLEYQKMKLKSRYRASVSGKESRSHFIQGTCPVAAPGKGKEKAWIDDVDANATDRMDKDKQDEELEEGEIDKKWVEKDNEKIRRKKENLKAKAGTLISSFSENKLVTDLVAILEIYGEQQDESERVRDFYAAGPLSSVDDNDYTPLKPVGGIDGILERVKTRVFRNSRGDIVQKINWVDELYLAARVLNFTSSSTALHMYGPHYDLRGGKGRYQYAVYIGPMDLYDTTMKTISTEAK
ncbi:hypothetical protein BDK51DRAFT_50347 [Blyttiomyces helicus]|uniref:Uncharacterized protein n=1 Tax=Blyttiomyces helicus TaxID=388810 RepID=A0A4P9WGV3_9FUNG|nr:hypothetical protein BDK51DRAFT_50347 [Blyttiomyces helicus]|eukprot:RKO90280.1 hypothetical protein BDK51DRAFT_50347 [Blyttiomyces helicus]